ncbi:MAG: hypothetical protein J5950_00410 [Clostridia bacterium]|nr:hypothetical protein [Clostridia bacterium]
MTDLVHTGDNGAELTGTDEFVKQTVKGCRLFTEPADEVKYYGEARREFWNSDSDEVMLLIQFFNNCIVSGDPESVVIALDGFGRLAKGDDEALHDVIGSVLLRHLDADALEALFDPENQPEYRRYNLALTAQFHPDLLTADRKERIFGVLKKRLKDMMKDRSPEDETLYEEAVILGEFGDGRAIPLLRRYASMLLEQGLRDKYSDLCNEIEKLGGTV